MKKFLLSAAAATMVAAPVLAAAPASAAQWHGRTTHSRTMVRHTTYRAPARVSYRQTYRPAYHAWNRGDLDAYPAFVWR